MSESAEYKLDELAEVSGFPPRTIRLYISEGILPPPLNAGPRAAYGPLHRERLAQIRQWQREGLTIAGIRERLAPAPPRGNALPPPEVTERYQLAPDVIVELRRPMPPRRLRQILKAMNQFAGEISPDSGGPIDDEQHEPRW